MRRRILGLGLLALVLFAAVFGLWRTSVWESGKAEDQWYSRPTNQELALLEQGIERQHKAVEAARQGGDAQILHLAELKLQLIQSDQFRGKTDVIIAGWVEGGMAITGLAVAFFLGNLGWRRWQPRKSEKAAEPPPA